MQNSLKIATTKVVPWVGGLMSNGSIDAQYVLYINYARDK